MTVTRKQIMNELIMELDKTKLDHTEDNFAAICDQVVNEWKYNALIYLDRGYATGEYRSSIRRETIRATRAEGGNLGGWKSRAVTYDKIAHLLEYGTEADHDGKEGSWFSVKDGRWHTTGNTPTPAFGLAAMVENSFNSTVAKAPRKRRRKSHYPPINRRPRPNNQEVFAEWEANNPEEAEKYRNNRTSASIMRSWLRYSDQNPS